MGEYAYVAQRTSVAEVANTNLSGQSLSYGPKVEYYDGKESIGLFFRLNSGYSLNKSDVNGDTQYYSAKTGFNIQYTRRLKGKLGVVVDYAREEYGRSLPDSVKWDRLSVGFVLTNYDKYPFPLAD